jgi:hypothetical protein
VTGVQTCALPISPPPPPPPPPEHAAKEPSHRPCTTKGTEVLRTMGCGMFPQGAR